MKKILLAVLLLSSISAFARPTETRINGTLGSAGTNVQGQDIFKFTCPAATFAIYAFVESQTIGSSYMIGQVGATYKAAGAKKATFQVSPPAYDTNGGDGVTSGTIYSKVRYDQVNPAKNNYLYVTKLTYPAFVGAVNYQITVKCLVHTAYTVNFEAPLAISYYQNQ